MTIYMLPAVLALFATAYILVFSYPKTGQPKVFFTLVLIFLAHHICELLGFLEFIKDSPHVIYQLKLYYIVSIWCLTYILLYSIDTSRLLIKHSSAVLISISSIVSLVILQTDAIIAGAYSIGYIMTAEKGAYYFIFQLFAIMSLLSTITILVYGYVKSKTHIVEIQCMYMILAFAPLLISTLIVLMLMAIGIKINAIAIVPVSTTLFLIITYRSEAQHKLTDLRRFMPLSPERKASQEIMALYSSYAQDEISYRDCMAKIERLMVIHKYNKSGNNASATAKSMGMPRSSLYSLFNRLKIDVKEQ